MVFKGRSESYLQYPINWAFNKKAPVKKTDAFLRIYEKNYKVFGSKLKIVANELITLSISATVTLYKLVDK